MDSNRPGDPPIAVAAAVIEREGRVLLGRRPREKRHGGLWEFPGGKLDRDESLEQAIERELREELGLQFEGLGPTLYRAVDPGSPFEVHFVKVFVRGIPTAIEHEEITWCPWRHLGGLELAPADRRFVAEWTGALESDT